MSSTSLFDAMEFTGLSVGNYLDESFGLSAEILAADFGSEGSILDSDFGHFGGLKYESEQPASGSLDDVLLLPDAADSLGQEWMETVDLKSLLNSFEDGQARLETIDLSSIPVSRPEPIPTSIKIEPRKEGMKASAYEKLKALLTGAGQDAETVDLGVPSVPPSPQSPEALVPNLPFVAPSFDSLLEETTENVLEDLIQLQPAVEVSLTNGEVLVESNINIVELLAPVTDVSQSLNTSDCETYFTSGPSSPSDSFTLETVDLAGLSDIDSSVSSSNKGSQISGYEFTKLKSKSKRGSGRSTPYEVEVTKNDNKKDRKKAQNKNAATRYRVKKRVEKESLQKQESRLSDKNKELKEKVESLQREILYMKELMNEIYKAKKSKI